MANANPQRFTIGHAMVVTALFAVLFYAGFADPQSAGPFGSILNPVFLVRRTVSLSLIAVCLSHFSLSKHIRLMVAGLIGSFLNDLASVVAFALLFDQSPASPILYLRIQWIMSEVCTLLFIYGLFLTFRDLKRKLGDSREFGLSSVRAVDPTKESQDITST